ncbi:MAG: hypothetical protein ACR2HS_00100 [Gammaproteobacteria bacterium]
MLTIYKYLSQWKEICYKQAIWVVIACKQNNYFGDKKRILKQTLQKQNSQREHYDSELISSEKFVVKLKEENYYWQAIVHNFKEEQIVSN